MVVRRLGIAFVLLAAGCSGSSQTPGEVVEAYFRAMGRDPIRTLPLVTPAFHVRHGVHVVTSAEAKQSHGHDDTTPLATDSLAVDRLELGWLMIQVRPGFARNIAELGVVTRTVETTGDTTRVATRIAPREGSPFEQDFSLVRDARGTWRIDAIEQRGVDATNGFAAFVAHPTDAARRALEASLRKRGR